MNPSSGNNAFSAADIERYHRGLMSPAERHALEKAALDDPFLADALDGYAFTPTPAADVTALRERLFPAKEERPSGGLVFLRSPWLRAAAAILVLAGAGWFAFRNTPSGLKNESYSDQRTSAAPAPAKDTKSVTETGRVKDSLSLPAAIAPATNAQAPAQPVKAGSNEPLPEMTAAVPVQAREPIILLADTTPNSRWTNNDVALNRNIYRRSGPMLNNANIARNNNVAYSNEKERASRNFTAPAPVASATTTVSVAELNKRYDSLGYIQPATALKGKISDTVRNFDVVLQEEKLSLDEVVVMGKGIDRKKLARPQGKVDTLEGAEYAYRFDEYVAENLRMPDDIRDKTQRGEVVLSFDVNSQGEPVNIKVAKSLCEKCDEEAIRLLKEGPKWKKKEKKKKVTIKF